VAAGNGAKSDYDAVIVGASLVGSATSMLLPREGARWPWSSADRTHEPRLGARPPMNEGAAQEALLARVLALAFRGLRAEVETDPPPTGGDEA
jgi:2-polyprenyl-6-methoxyphenol hydroxylase-like FAD-dependent oxidoreductase